MEGLKPPPKASHPFPDNPNLNKFWGTRTGTSFFKSFGVFATFFTSLWALNFYVTKDQRGIYGLDILGSEDQQDVLAKKFESLLSMDWYHLGPIGLPITREGAVTNRKIRFDDAVVVDPHKFR